MTIGGLLALVFVLIVGAFALIIYPAIWVASHISDSEREEEEIEQLRIKDQQ